MLKSKTEQRRLSKNLLINRIKVSRVKVVASCPEGWGLAVDIVHNWWVQSSGDFG